MPAVHRVASKAPVTRLAADLVFKRSSSADKTGKRQIFAGRYASRYGSILATSEDLDLNERKEKDEESGGSGMPYNVHKHLLDPYKAPDIPVGHRKFEEGDHKAYTSQFANTTIESRTEVEQWTEPIVAGWIAALEKGKFEMYCIMFMDHEVDGKILLRLTEDNLNEIGVQSCGERMKLMDHIQLLQRRCNKPETAQLSVPGWATCLIRMVDFGWADTSEAKDGHEMKEELVHANTSIALVSTLTWAIAWELFFSSSSQCFCHNASTECVCSTSWDMPGRPLSVFYSFAGIASVSFMFSTVYSVLQNIMVFEMSGEREVLEFFALVKADSQLPGIYLFFGLGSFCVPVVVYVVYNVNMGLVPGPATAEQNAFSWLLAGGALLLSLWGFLYKAPQWIRHVYQAKSEACRLERLPPTHTFHGHFARS